MAAPITARRFADAFIVVPLLPPPGAAADAEVLPWS
jgi:hypothetical protein